MNSNQVAKYRFKLRVWQFGLLAAIFFVWWALTKPGLIPAFVFDNDNQAAFFFGEPLVIFSRIWDWFVVNADIYAHLWTTLVETILAFAFGGFLYRVFQCLSGGQGSQSERFGICSYAWGQSSAVAKKRLSAVGHELGIFIASYISRHGICRCGGR